METTREAEVRILKEENKALRAGISLMHRRAQQSEGAEHRAARDRLSFAKLLGDEKRRLARYEQMALQDKANYQMHLVELVDQIDALENEGLVKFLLRWLGFR